MMSSRTQLDSDMKNISDGLLRLSSLVNEGLNMAFDAVIKFDTDAAQDLINRDQILNALTEELEYQVEKTVALQQPAARDLRILIASMLIATELERMGDHAVGISRTILKEDAEPSERLPDVLFKMKDIVQKMLEDGMVAFTANDPDRAREVAERDQQVDDFYQLLFTELITNMSSGELSVARGTYLLWAGHNLERIGDRVTNICERGVYVETGEVDKLNVKPEDELE